MSYGVIKNYFVRRLASFGLTEADKTLDFSSESENYNNKYTIQNPTMDMDRADTLATRFFPKRTFVISLAFKISESAITKEYAACQARIENVIRDLHSVFNYRTDSIRTIWFTNSKVEPVEDYISAQLTFIVEDSLDYVTA